MQTGNRTGVGTELMKAEVAKLSADDMVAIAAYLTSREP
jgi:cytochrome c553